MKKPEAFNSASKDKGALNFRMTCCEIEGRKTIHLDAFHEVELPYGHISAAHAKNMHAWMSRALKWIEVSK